MAEGNEELTGEKLSLSETLQAIKNAISSENTGAPSHLLVYYSGHGAQHGNEYILQTGPTSDRCVEASWLKSQLEQINVRHLLVILDCCYAAGFPILPSLSSGSQVSQTMWASSSRGEISTGSRQTGGMFTKYVVSALRSGSQCFLEAQSSDRGDQSQCHICKALHTQCKSLECLTLARIQSYVFDHVTEESLRSNSMQRPLKVETSHTEVPLAYAHSTPLSYTLWFVSDGEVRIPVFLENLDKNLDDLRKDLFIQLKGIFVLILTAHYKLFYQCNRND